jgi:curved DNA-binding protein
MDYYNILGVNRGADNNELKHAYKKASMKHHPDRGGDAEKFKEVNEAYSTLKDPQKRQQYDNPQAQAQFNTQNMNGNFGDIFAQFGFRQQQQQQRNPDVTIAVDITLEECVTGKQVLATFRLRNGREETVDINIPPGAINGNQVRYQGLGEEIIPGPRGNLIVQIQVQRHSMFDRDGHNLIMRHRISVIDLLLGCQDNIPTIEGTKIRLTIPAGTKPGVMFNVTGHGLPEVNTNRRGNMFVTLDAYTPLLNDPVDLIKLKEIKDNLLK